MPIRLYGGMSRKMSYEAIPSAIFTTPEARNGGADPKKEAIAKHGEDNIRVFPLTLSSDVLHLAEQG